MLGIIGGTGFSTLDGLSILEETVVDTPFGKASSPLVKMRYGSLECYFLSRHGPQQLLPHEVNYRANIYALKMLGVRQIVGFSAVGSLREEIAPGDIVLPSQYIDWVKGGRPKSFFGNGLAAHVSTALPTCRVLSDALACAADAPTCTAAPPQQGVHRDKTYVCVDGPRLGTQAESHFFRHMGCDLVGMTNVPEAFLAREAQICYSTVGLVSDYDCWKDDPADHADTATIIARYGASLNRAKALLLAFLENGPPPPCPTCRTSLQGALLTPRHALSASAREILAVLEA